MTLEEVGNSFYARIVKYCYYRTSKNRADAEDIAGEVFLRLGQKWDTLKNYDGNIILGWLYGTANKVMLEQHKIKLTQEAMTLSLTANNGADIELPDGLLWIVSSATKNITLLTKTLRGFLSKRWAN